MKDNIIDFSERVDERIKTKEQVLLMEKRKEAISKLPQFRGEIPSKNLIRKLINVKIGEIFWVTGDNKAYIVAGKDRQKLTIKALDETATLSTGMTLYQMNKKIVSKEPLFDWENKEAVERLKNRLWKWFHEDSCDHFYMLYGRDIHYVSLIEISTRRDGNLTGLVIDEMEMIRDIVSNIGGLISIDFNVSDNETSVEIWVRTADSAAELLYLFPYDRGLIVN